jgi:glucose-6-phosphate 1-dehydrogenase
VRLRHLRRVRRPDAKQAAAGNFQSSEEGHLPEEFAILGIARPRIDQSEYRKQMREQVRQAEGEPLEPAKWKRIEDRLYYVSGEFDDPALFERREADAGRDVSAASHSSNVLFYFAVPPDLFGSSPMRLADAGLLKEDEGWRRVIIEKPFGYDLKSARALNTELRKGLRESQIYRIDHYLGKETVQNILALRFANGILRTHLEPTLRGLGPDDGRRRELASADEAPTTTTRVRYATSCRTTCSRSSRS